MKRYSLRLPDDLHDYLKRWAERERRSLNDQLLWILEQATHANQQQERQDDTRPQDTSEPDA